MLTSLSSPPRPPIAQAVLPALLLAVPLLLAGCAVGPDYERPPIDIGGSFKEAGDWVPATPAEAIERGQWWQLFADPQLDALMAQLDVSNQNIAAAVAAYDQSRALVRQQRASLFPSVDLSFGVTRTGSGSSRNNVVTGGTVSSSNNRIRNNYQTSIGASWEPDIWGRLRRNVENAEAGAQASAADLALARLSAQGELATNYLSLRQADAEIALLQQTLEGYARALEIANNRYKVGVAPKTDVLSAQTQFYNTQAELEGLHRTRATLEHAVAVLLGKVPAQFSLLPAEWNPQVPQVPVGLPSALLQRRPDIASAERQMAAANDSIGIAKAAWFPSFSLSGSYGANSQTLGDLFETSATVWSLGASAAQTLLDFGARKAQVEQARASYRQAVANYRQTTLTAFQEVEDNLSATRVLERQYELRQQASAIADENERLILNQYRAGKIAFVEVVTASASALSARRTLSQAALDRQTTAVALIQAIGGGWQGVDDDAAATRDR